MNFVEQIAPYAVKYMKSEGILASLSLAQAVLESDKGNSELAVNANNLFGIKAKPPWTGPIYIKRTKEFVNDKWIEVVADFCKFNSLEECFEYRSRVFLKRPHYKPLWGITDYKKAAQIIWQCGYATDPEYPQKLVNKIEELKLYLYDKEVNKVVKIFIDPGHGGTDPGAVGNGLLEKMLTLTISKRIRDMLTRYEDVIVKLSREDDQTLSLKQRTDMANAWGADFLLSIHINATPGGYGYEDFVYPNSSGATFAYQNAIHEEVMKQVDFRDRGKKQGNLHMLRESKMPALLTENGFIDNAADAAKLKQDAYINKIAQGHVNGLVRAFNLKEKAQSVLMWGKTEFKKGQIGRVEILKPINLWTEDAAGKLQMVRILQPGDQYRVYGFRPDHGGQYDVGANHWVTKMDGYIKYETPSKTLLAKVAEVYM
ncbi:N-acetylmuramoyl-L-alanine amidase [Bacillus sp. S/N-304-OC-R1]|nr:N-acetylmuramoyl-L-alanine amidase [Bacillus sp. S/N-304-OC-R1]